MVALFDIKVRDATEGGGADVHVGQGLDLTGSADSGNQVLLRGFARGDGCNAVAAMNDGADDDTGDDDEDGDE